jgi:hypothetical protein
MNTTSQIQIARITNIENWYFERVVFPGQRLVFEALPQAQLEIHTGMMASSILSDMIPCERLSINHPLADETEGAGLAPSQEDRLPPPTHLHGVLEPDSAAAKEKALLA